MKRIILVSVLLSSFLLGLVYGLIAWQRPRATLPNNIVSSQLPNLEIISTWNEPERGGEDRYAHRLPGMDCLVNRHGIRRKVIVTQANVQCVSEPTGRTAVGPTLRFFTPYFVFDVAPRDGEIAFYRIGPTPQRETVIGWVPASQVAPWDTRVGARYARGSGNRTLPLLVYEGVEGLEELIKTGTTQRPPLARASNDSSRSFMPWPIVEVRQFTHAGRTHEFLRLNFLGEHKQGSALHRATTSDRRGREQYTPGEVQEIKRGVKMVDIVFCVDTTKSTAPEIAAMRDSIQMIASRLNELHFQPDVSCGLVLYRDYVPSTMFTENGQPSPVKFFPLETNLPAFLTKVGDVQEAQQGSEDFPEAVFDGVLAALARPQWRGDGLSTRIVILIGDNSGHEAGHPKNPKNITGERLVRLAQERDRNVKIFSLCVDGGGDVAERRRHQQQFRQLAQGTGGECFRLDDAPRIVERVKAILDSQTAVVHQRSAVLDALTEGKTKDQIAAEKQIDVREVTEVMEFLAGGGVDLERLRPGVPTFATGWCLAELNGVPLLEREVYVARAELDMLLSELNSLCVQLSPDLTRQVFRTGLGSRINPMSFFAQERSEPMDMFLMAQGIPCSQGLLKLTRSEIEHMSEERRAVLRERIARRVVPELTNARNNDAYFTWLDDLEFGWVSESLFP